ncbi:MAG: D-glycerate dehydrogenase [Betaproteobacteria bacterium]|nr:D-glycerate dehydrogenase [Betaproteobacteria bacterium]
MNAKDPVRIVFSEEDTLFRLMEMAVLRRLTPEGEKTLNYFFGANFSAPLQVLTSMAERLGLPADMQSLVCADDAALDRALPTADFLVTETAAITRERVRACAGRIKLIQKFGRDCGNIDLATARELGLKVANLARFSSLSSADHVIALLLALARNLLHAHRTVLARRDPGLKPQFEKAPPRNKFNWGAIRNIRVLAEQTLGLIGLGENSGEVAKRARLLGMRVLYYKRQRLSSEEEAALGGVRYVDFDGLLAQSDFVSIHVPYGKPTEKMIGSDALRKMKRGAYLINTARGGIVDEEALHEALKSGQLAGAALDVYRFEPVPPDCPLLDLDSVLWTPHISGGEPEFMLRESEDVLANVARVLRGETPSGLVGIGGR